MKEERFPHSGTKPLVIFTPNVFSDRQNKSEVKLNLLLISQDIGLINTNIKIKLQLLKLCETKAEVLFLFEFDQLTLLIYSKVKNGFIMKNGKKLKYDRAQSYCLVDVFLSILMGYVCSQCTECGQGQHTAHLKTSII